MTPSGRIDPHLAHRTHPALPQPGVNASAVIRMNTGQHSHGVADVEGVTTDLALLLQIPTAANQHTHGSVTDTARRNQAPGSSHTRCI